jgi:hypothetical protein
MKRLFLSIFLSLTLLTPNSIETGHWVRFKKGAESVARKVKNAAVKVKRKFVREDGSITGLGYASGAATLGGGGFMLYKIFGNLNKDLQKQSLRQEQGGIPIQIVHKDIPKVSKWGEDYEKYQIGDSYGHILSDEDKQFYRDHPEKIATATIAAPGIIKKIIKDTPRKIGSWFKGKPTTPGVEVPKQSSHWSSRFGGDSTPHSRAVKQFNHAKDTSKVQWGDGLKSHHNKTTKLDTSKLDTSKLDTSKLDRSKFQWGDGLKSRHMNLNNKPNKSLVERIGNWGKSIQKKVSRVGSKFGEDMNAVGYGK